MAKTYAGKAWGNDQSNALDVPDWEYLSLNTKLTGGAAANLGASGSGWTSQMPGAEGVGHGEILVAVGGLKMPAIVVSFMNLMSTTPANVANSMIAVQVQMNQGVVVTDANAANVYIVAIGSDPANLAVAVANVNLLYVAGKSQPESGVLWFETDGVDLTTDIANDTLTINSTSTFHGVVASRKKKGPALTLVNATAIGGNGLVITIS